MINTRSKLFDECVQNKTTSLIKNATVTNNDKYMEQDLQCKNSNDTRRMLMQHKKLQRNASVRQTSQALGDNVQVQRRHKQLVPLLCSNTQEAINAIDNSDNVMLPKWFPSLNYQLECKQGSTNTVKKKQRSQQQQQQQCVNQVQQPCLTLHRKKEGNLQNAPSAKETQKTVINGQCRQQIRVDNINSLGDVVNRKGNVIATFNQTYEANGKGINNSNNTYVNQDLSSVDKEQLLRLQRRQVHLLRELRDRTFALRQAQLTIRKLQEQLAQHEKRNNTIVQQSLNSFPCLTTAQRQLMLFDNFLTPLKTHVDELQQKLTDGDVQQVRSTDCVLDAKTNTCQRVHSNQLRMRSAIYAFVNRSLKNNTEKVKDINIRDDCKLLVQQSGEHNDNYAINNRIMQPQLSEWQMSQRVTEYTPRKAKDMISAKPFMMSQHYYIDRHNQATNVIQDQIFATANATTITTSTTTSTSMASSDLQQTQTACRSSQYSCTDDIATIGKSNYSSINGAYTIRLDDKKYLINALRKRKILNDKIAVSAPAYITSINAVLNQQIAANNQLLEQTSSRCSQLTDIAVNEAPKVKRSKQFILPSRKDNTHTTYTLPPFHGYSLKSEADILNQCNFDSVKKNAECGDCDYEM